MGFCRLGPVHAPAGEHCQAVVVGEDTCAHDRATLPIRFPAKDRSCSPRDRPLADADTVSRYRPSRQPGGRCAVDCSFGRGGSNRPNRPHDVDGCGSEDRQASDRLVLLHIPCIPLLMGMLARNASHSSLRHRSPCFLRAIFRTTGWTSACSVGRWLVIDREVVRRQLAW